MASGSSKGIRGNAAKEMKDGIQNIIGSLKGMSDFIINGEVRVDDSPIDKAKEKFEDLRKEVETPLEPSIDAKGLKKDMKKVQADTKKVEKDVAKAVNVQPRKTKKNEIQPSEKDIYDTPTIQNRIKALENFMDGVIAKTEEVNDKGKSKKLTDNQAERFVQNYVEYALYAKKFGFNKKNEYVNMFEEFKDFSMKEFKKIAKKDQDRQLFVSTPEEAQIIADGIKTRIDEKTKKPVPGVYYVNAKKEFDKRYETATNVATRNIQAQQRAQRKAGVEIVASSESGNNTQDNTATAAGVNNEVNATRKSLEETLDHINKIGRQVNSLMASVDEKLADGFMANGGKEYYEKETEEINAMINKASELRAMLKEIDMDTEAGKYADKMSSNHSYQNRINGIRGTLDTIDTLIPDMGAMLDSMYSEESIERAQREAEARIQSAAENIWQKITSHELYKNNYGRGKWLDEIKQKLKDGADDADKIIDEYVKKMEDNKILQDTQAKKVERKGNLKDFLMSKFTGNKRNKEERKKYFEQYADYFEQIKDLNVSMDDIFAQIQAKWDAEAPNTENESQIKLLGSLEEVEQAYKNLAAAKEKYHKAKATKDSFADISDQSALMRERRRRSWDAFDSATMEYQDAFTKYNGYFQNKEDAEKWGAQYDATHVKEVVTEEQDAVARSQAAIRAELEETNEIIAEQEAWMEKVKAANDMTQNSGRDKRKIKAKLKASAEEYELYKQNPDEYDAIDRVRIPMQYYNIQEYAKQYLDEATLSKYQQISREEAKEAQQAFIEENRRRMEVLHEARERQQALTVEYNQSEIQSLQKQLNTTVRKEQNKINREIKSYQQGVLDTQTHENQKLILEKYDNKQRESSAEYLDFQFTPEYEQLDDKAKGLVEGLIQSYQKLEMIKKDGGLEYLQMLAREKELTEEIDTAKEKFFNIQDKINSGTATADDVAALNEQKDTIDSLIAKLGELDESKAKTYGIFGLSKHEAGSGDIQRQITNLEQMKKDADDAIKAINAIPQSEQEKPNQQQKPAEGQSTSGYVYSEDENSSLEKRLELLKKIKAEAKFLDTAYDKKDYMEEHDYEYGGDNPRATDEQSRKLTQKWDDHIDHMEKAEQATEKFEEAYSKLIITMKNGEKIEIDELRADDMLDLSLDKRKIKDIQLIPTQDFEEEVNHFEEAKNRFDNLIDDITGKNQQNLKKGRQLISVEEADQEIEKLNESIRKLKEFRAEYENIDYSLSGYDKDAFSGMFEDVDKTVHKLENIKSNFETQRTTLQTQKNVGFIDDIKSLENYSFADQGFIQNLYSEVISGTKEYDQAMDILIQHIKQKHDEAMKAAEKSNRDEAEVAKYDELAKPILEQMGIKGNDQRPSEYYNFVDAIRKESIDAEEALNRFAKAVGYVYDETSNTWSKNRNAQDVAAELRQVREEMDKFYEVNKELSANELMTGFDALKQKAKGLEDELEQLAGTKDAVEQFSKSIPSFEDGISVETLRENEGLYNKLIDQVREGALQAEDAIKQMNDALKATARKNNDPFGYGITGTSTEMNAQMQYLTQMRKLMGDNFDEAQALSQALSLLGDIKSGNIEALMGRFVAPNKASNAMLQVMTDMSVATQKDRDAALRSLNPEEYDRIIREQAEAAQAELDKQKNSFKDKWAEVANAMIGGDAFTDATPMEKGRIVKELEKYTDTAKDAIDEINKQWLSGTLDTKKFSGKYAKQYIGMLNDAKESAEFKKGVAVGDIDMKAYFFGGDKDATYTKERVDALHAEAAAYDELIAKKKEYYGILDSQLTDIETKTKKIVEDIGSMLKQPIMQDQNEDYYTTLLSQIEAIVPAAKELREQLGELAIPEDATELTGRAQALGDQFKWIDQMVGQQKDKIHQVYDNIDFEAKKATEAFEQRMAQRTSDITQRITSNPDFEKYGEQGWLQKYINRVRREVADVDEIYADFEKELAERKQNIIAQEEKDTRTEENRSKFLSHLKGLSPTGVEEFEANKAKFSDVFNSITDDAKTLEDAISRVNEELQKTGDAPADSVDDLRQRLVKLFNGDWKAYDIYEVLGMSKEDANKNKLGSFVADNLLFGDTSAEEKADKVLQWYEKVKAAAKEAADASKEASDSMGDTTDSAPEKEAQTVDELIQKYKELQQVLSDISSGKNTTDKSDDISSEMRNVGDKLKEAGMYLDDDKWIKDTVDLEDTYQHLLTMISSSDYDGINQMFGSFVKNADDVEVLRMRFEALKQTLEEAGVDIENMKLSWFKGSIGADWLSDDLSVAFKGAFANLDLPDNNAVFQNFINNLNDLKNATNNANTSDPSGTKAQADAERDQAKAAEEAAKAEEERKKATDDANNVPPPDDGKGNKDKGKTPSGGESGAPKDGRTVTKITNKDDGSWERKYRLSNGRVLIHGERKQWDEDGNEIEPLVYEKEITDLQQLEREAITVTNQLTDATISLKAAERQGYGDSEFADKLRERIELLKEQKRALNQLAKTYDQVPQDNGEEWQVRKDEYSYEAYRKRVGDETRLHRNAAEAKDARHLIQEQEALLRQQDNNAAFVTQWKSRINRLSSKYLDPKNNPIKIPEADLKELNKIRYGISKTGEIGDASNIYGGIEKWFIEHGSPNSTTNAAEREYVRQLTKDWEQKAKLSVESQKIATKLAAATPEEAQASIQANMNALMRDIERSKADVSAVKEELNKVKSDYEEEMKKKDRGEDSRIDDKGFLKSIHSRLNVARSNFKDAQDEFKTNTAEYKEQLDIIEQLNKARSAVNKNIAAEIAGRPVTDATAAIEELEQKAKDAYDAVQKLYEMYSEGKISNKQLDDAIETYEEARDYGSTQSRNAIQKAINAKTSKDTKKQLNDYANNIAEYKRLYEKSLGGKLTQEETGKMETLLRSISEQEEKWNASKIQGLVLSQKQLQAVERLNKAKEDGTTTTEDIKTQTAQEIAQERYAKMQAKIQKMYGQAEWRSDPDKWIAEVDKLYDELSNIKIEITNPDELKGVTDALDEMEQKRQALAKGSKLQPIAIDTQAKLTNNLEKWMDKNKIAAKEYEEQLESLKERIKEVTSKQELENWNKDFQLIQAEAAEKGLLGKSLGDRFKDQFKNTMTSLATYYLSFQDFVRYGRQAISTVTELDTQLTEMRKVSNESLSTLQNYQLESFDIANRVGTTASQIQASTADWMRLGEKLPDAKKSAEYSNLLLNVSEFQDINAATEALTAMSQAYQDLDKLDIIDKLNNIGNNYSISTSELAESLQRSAGTLKVAGNSLDEAIALTVAGNQVLQNPQMVGQSLRTIALRLTGTSVEDMQEAGEEIDGLISTQSKLRKTIMDITKVSSNGYKGFDILDEHGNYKSTYEMLSGIAAVWHDIGEEDKKMGSNRQSLLLETIAGKTRAAAAASILDNFGTLTDVYESSLNSQGSAQQELDKYLDSINGKTAQFKNNLQELASITIDSGWIKGIVDFGSKALKVVSSLSKAFGGINLLIGGGLAGFFQANGKGLFTKDKKTKKWGSGLLDSVLGIKDNIVKFFHKQQFGDEILDSMFSGMGKSDKIYDIVAKAEAKADGKKLPDKFVLWWNKLGTGEGEDQEAAQKAAVLGDALDDVGDSVFSLSGAFSSLGSIAMTALSTLGTMAIITAVTMAFEALATAIYNVVTAEERAIERGREARESIKDINDAYNEKKTFVNDNTKRYNELRQGVTITEDDGVQNKNLSTDEFQEFLSINNELANLFPSLVSSYDAQGNAMLTLSSDAETASSSLQKLLEQERQIADYEVGEQLNDAVTGFLTRYKQLQEEIGKQDKTIAAAQELQSAIEEKTGEGIDLKKLGVSLEGVNMHYEFDPFDKTQRAVADTIYQAYNEASEGIGRVEWSGDYAITGELIGSLTYASQEDLDKFEEAFRTRLSEMKLGDIPEEIIDAMSIKNRDIQEIKADWNGLIPSILSQLNLYEDYQKLGNMTFGKQLQNIIADDISNIDFDHFEQIYGEGSWEKFGQNSRSFVRENFLDPITESLKDKEGNFEQEKIDALNKLISFDGSKMTNKVYRDEVDKLVGQITEVPEIQRKIKVLLGFEYYDEEGKTHWDVTKRRDDLYESLGGYVGYDKITGKKEQHHKVGMEIYWSDFIKLNQSDLEALEYAQETMGEDLTNYNQSFDDLKGLIDRAKKAMVESTDIAKEGVLSDIFNGELYQSNVEGYEKRLTSLTGALDSLRTDGRLTAEAMMELQESFSDLTDFSIEGISKFGAKELSSWIGEFKSGWTDFSEEGEKQLDTYLANFTASYRKFAVSEQDVSTIIKENLGEQFKDANGYQSAQVASMVQGQYNEAIEALKAKYGEDLNWNIVLALKDQFTGDIDGLIAKYDNYKLVWDLEVHLEEVQQNIDDLLANRQLNSERNALKQAKGRSLTKEDYELDNSISQALVSSYAEQIAIAQNDIENNPDDKELVRTARTKIQELQQKIYQEQTTQTNNYNAIRDLPLKAIENERNRISQEMQAVDDAIKDRQASGEAQTEGQYKRQIDLLQQDNEQLQQAEGILQDRINLIEKYEGENAKENEFYKQWNSDLAENRKQQADNIRQQKEYQKQIDSMPLTKLQNIGTELARATSEAERQIANRQSIGGEITKDLYTTAISAAAAEQRNLEDIRTELINEADRVKTEFINDHNFRSTEEMEAALLQNEDWKTVMSNLDQNQTLIDGIIQKIREWNEAINNMDFSKLQHQSEQLSRNLELTKRDLEENPTEEGYTRALDINADQIENIQERLALKRRQLNQDLSDGVITAGSDAYYQMKSAIIELEDELYNAKNAQEDFNNALNDLPMEHLKSAFSLLKDESDAINRELEDNKTAENYEKAISKSIEMEKNLQRQINEKRKDTFDVDGNSILYSELDENDPRYVQWHSDLAQLEGELYTQRHNTSDLRSGKQNFKIEKIERERTKIQREMDKLQDSITSGEDRGQTQFTPQYENLIELTRQDTAKLEEEQAVLERRQRNRKNIFGKLNRDVEQIPGYLDDEARLVEIKKTQYENRRKIAEYQKKIDNYPLAELQTEREELSYQTEQANKRLQRKRDKGVEELTEADYMDALRTSANERSNLFQQRNEIQEQIRQMEDTIEAAGGSLESLKKNRVFLDLQRQLRETNTEIENMDDSIVQLLNDMNNLTIERLERQFSNLELDMQEIQRDLDDTKKSNTAGDYLRAIGKNYEEQENLRKRIEEEQNSVFYDEETGLSTRYEDLNKNSQAYIDHRNRLADLEEQLYSTTNAHDDFVESLITLPITKIEKGIQDYSNDLDILEARQQYRAAQGWEQLGAEDYDERIALNNRAVAGYGAKALAENVVSAFYGAINDKTRQEEHKQNAVEATKNWWNYLAEGMGLQKGKDDLAIDIANSELGRLQTQNSRLQSEFEELQRNGQEINKDSYAALQQNVQDQIEQQKILRDTALRRRGEAGPQYKEDEEGNKILNANWAKYNEQYNSALSSLIDLENQQREYNYAIEDIPLVKLQDTMTELQATATETQEIMSLNEAKGLKASIKDYKKLIANSKKQKENLDSQNDILRDQRRNLIDIYGQNAKNLQRYKDIEAQLNSNNSAIRQAEQEVLDYENQIRTFELTDAQSLLSSLQTALSETGTQTGLTVDTMKELERSFSDLKGIDITTLFYRTADGVKLDTNAVANLIEKENELKNNSLEQKIAAKRAEIDKFKNSTDDVDLGKLRSLQDELIDLLNLQSQYFATYQEQLAALNEHSMIALADQTENAGDNYRKGKDYLSSAYEFWDTGRTGIDDFKERAAYFDYYGRTDAETFKAHYDKYKDFYTENASGLIKFYDYLVDVGVAMKDIDGAYQLIEHDTQIAARKAGMSVQAYKDLLSLGREYGGTFFAVDSEEDAAQQRTGLLSDLRNAQTELINFERMGAESSVLDQKRDEIQSIQSQIQGLQKATDGYTESRDRLHDANLTNVKKEWEQMQRWRNEAMKSKNGQPADIETQRYWEDQMRQLAEEYNLEITPDFKFDEAGWRQLVDKAFPGGEQMLELSMKYNINPSDVEEAKTKISTVIGDDVNDIKQKVQESGITEFSIDDLMQINHADGQWSAGEHEIEALAKSLGLAENQCNALIAALIELGGLDTGDQIDEDFVKRYNEVASNKELFDRSKLNGYSEAIDGYVDTLSRFSQSDFDTIEWGDNVTQVEGAEAALDGILSELGLGQEYGEALLAVLGEMGLIDYKPEVDVSEIENATKETEELQQEVEKPAEKHIKVKVDNESEPGQWTNEQGMVQRIAESSAASRAENLRAERTHRSEIVETVTTKLSEGSVTPQEISEMTQDQLVSIGIDVQGGKDLQLVKETAEQLSAQDGFDFVVKIDEAQMGQITELLKPSEEPIPITADISGAQTQIQSLADTPVIIKPVANIEIARDLIKGLESDAIILRPTAQIQNAISSIKMLENLVITLKPTASIEVATSTIKSLESTPVTLNPTANVETATTAITGLSETPVEVNVTANTSSAQQSITALDGTIVKLKPVLDSAGLQASILAIEPITVKAKLDIQNNPDENGGGVGAKPVNVLSYGAEQNKNIVNNVVETNETHKVQDIKEEVTSKTTNYEGDASGAVGAANAATDAIENVPSFHKTEIVGDSSSAVAAANSATGAINNIPSSHNTAITATGADTVLSNVTAIKNKLDEIKDKSFTITEIHKIIGSTTAENASGGQSVGSAFGPYTGTMLSPAYAQGTGLFDGERFVDRQNIGNGQVGLRRNETALVNELGTESRIRDGKWELLPKGMHVENLKRGDEKFVTHVW